MWSGAYAEEGLPFEVRCERCGELISGNEYKDYEALCLACYHDLLTARPRFPPPGAPAGFAHGSAGRSDAPVEVLPAPAPAVEEWDTLIH